MTTVLTFDFTTASVSSVTLVLPLYKSVSPVGSITTIIWGDGTSVNNAGNNPSKTYDITTNKKFTVTITGDNLILNNESALTVYSTYLTGCSNLTNIINLTAAFRSCTKLTTITGILSIEVKNMSFMFFGATGFNGNLNDWDVSKVTDMSSMFQGASAFNGNISAWDVSEVTTMASMFQGATAFNQDISGWNVSKVTNMGSMFEGASTFNQDISGWNIGKNVTGTINMASMFNGASKFNKDINYVLSSGAWDVSKVIDMSSMFQDASAFNGNISAWKVGKVLYMSSMFQGASKFNKDINYNSSTKAWDVSQVTNMSSMFKGATAFYGDIREWDVSEVTNMSSMFEGASEFNRDISGWKVGKVTTMASMFKGASKFNKNINYVLSSGAWDVSKVIDMSSMFQDASAFNGNISAWDVSEVTTMASMFQGATAFNQDISGWNVSEVTNVSSMFQGATAFNQDISGWNVSEVTNMSSMFQGATAFNQDISGWNVSEVTNMSSMFQDASAFNQDISGWNVSEVTNMSSMFQDASAFNQDISGWDISKVTNYTNFSTIRNGTATLDTTYDYMSPITMTVKLFIPKFPISYSVSVKKDNTTKQLESYYTSYSYTFIPFTSQLTIDYLASVQLSIVLTVFGNTITIPSGFFSITPHVILMNSSYDYFTNITGSLNTTETNSFQFKLNNTLFGTGTLTNKQFSFNPYQKQVIPNFVGTDVTLSLVFSFITITTNTFRITFSDSIPIMNRLDYFKNTEVDLPQPTSVSLNLFPFSTIIKTLDNSINSNQKYIFNPFTNKVLNKSLGINVYLSFSFNGNIIISTIFQITPPSILMNPSYNYFTDITASLDIGSQSAPTIITLNTKTLTGTSTGTKYTYTFNPFANQLVGYENKDFILTFTFANGNKVDSTPFKITPYVISLFTVYDYFSMITISELNLTPTQITTLGAYKVELSYNTFKIGTMGSRTDEGQTSILSTGTTFTTYSFNPFQLLTRTEPFPTRSNIPNSVTENKTNLLAYYLNKTLTLSLVFNSLTIHSTPFTIIPYVIQLNLFYYSFSRITAFLNPGFNTTATVQIKNGAQSISSTTVDIPSTITITPTVLPVNVPLTLSFTINGVDVISNPFTIKTYKVQMEPSYHYFSTITAIVSLDYTILSSLHSVILNGNGVDGVSVIKTYTNILDTISSKKFTLNPYDIEPFVYYDTFFLSFVFADSTINSTDFEIIPPVVTINNPCDYFTDSIATFDVAPTQRYTVKLTSMELDSIDPPNQNYTFNPYTKMVPSSYLGSVTLSFIFTNITVATTFEITTTPFKIYPFPCNYFSGITAIFGFVPRLYTVNCSTTTTITLDTDVVSNLSSYTFNPYSKSTDTVIEFGTSTLIFVFDTITVTSETFIIPYPSIVVSPSYDYFKDITVTLDTRSIVVNPIIKLLKGTLSFPVDPVETLDYTNTNNTYTFNPYVDSVPSNYVSSVQVSFIFGKVTINSLPFTMTTPPFKIYPSPCNYFSGITAIFGFIPRLYTVNCSTTTLDTNVDSNLSSYTFTPYIKGLTTGNSSLSFVFSLSSGTITVDSESFEITTLKIKMNKTYDYFKDITVDLGFIPTTNFTVTLHSNNNSRPITITPSDRYCTFNPYTNSVTSDYLSMPVHLSFIFGSVTVRSDDFTITVPSIIVSPSYNYFKDITVALDTGSIVVNPIIKLIKGTVSFPTSLTYTKTNNTYTFNPYANSVPSNYVSSVQVSFIFNFITITSASFQIKTVPFQMNDMYDYFTDITVDFGFTPRSYQVKLPNKINNDTIITPGSSYTFNPYTNAMTNEYLNTPLTIKFTFDDIIILTTPFTITTSTIQMKQTYNYFQDITAKLEFNFNSYTVRLHGSKSSISLPDPTLATSYTFNPNDSSVFTKEYFNVPVTLYFIFDTIIVKSTPFVIITPTIQMNPFYDYDEDITVQVGFPTSYTVQLYSSTDFISLPNPTSSASYTFDPSQITTDYLNVPVTLFFNVNTSIVKSTSFRITLPRSI